MKQKKWVIKSDGKFVATHLGNGRGKLVEDIQVATKFYSEAAAKDELGRWYKGEIMEVEVENCKVLV